MKTLIFTLSWFISMGIHPFGTNAFSQNITNTLGANGLFTIKDASNNFLTLIQSTGQVNILKTLRLENTSNSGLGIMFKGADRFLHNYGTDNIFLGINSGNFTMGGTRNTAMGTNSLYSNTDGNYNTALGYRSLYANTTGNENTSLGFNSLFSNTEGFNNTAVGQKSLFFNTEGYSNLAIGSQSLYSNTVGILNTAVGPGALFYNTSGGQNTGLGYNAGSTITTGTNITCIGFGAEPTSGSANDQIILGGIYVTSLRCAVQTITGLSDARDKKNIEDLLLGLEFLMKIKPRLFNWDKREWYDNNISDGSKMNEAPTAGFIAQELDEVQSNENAEWLNLVLKDNPEKLEATSGNLLPVMVRAIQELKAENDLLKQNNEKLSAEVEAFKSMNEKLISLEKKVNELKSTKQTTSNIIEVKTISNEGDVK